VGDDLVVAGGTNFPDSPLWHNGIKAWHDRIFFYDSKTQAWKVVGQLARPVSYAVSFSVDDSIFVVGGQNATEVFDQAFRIRIIDGMARLDAPIPSLPEPLSMAAGCLIGRVLYVAGGVSSVKHPETTHAFYSLDLNADELSWKSLPAWPGPPRCLAAAGARNGEFILLGGLSRMSADRAEDYLKDAYSYTPSTGWRTLPSMLHPSAAAASPLPVAQDGTVVVIGGSDAPPSGQLPEDYPHVPRRVQMLSPSSHEWKMGGNPPMARVGVNTVFWRGGWFLPTGEISPGVRSPETWLLSFPTD
jgi:N-acetylneuraminic acid mutarotase